MDLRYHFLAQPDGFHLIKESKFSRQFLLFELIYLANRLQCIDREGPCQQSAETM